MNGLRIRIGWGLLLALWFTAALPSLASAQGYEIWRYDRPASQFKIYDSTGHQVRVVPFAWTRDIQFVPS